MCARFERSFHSQRANGWCNWILGRVFKTIAVVAVFLQCSVEFECFFFTLCPHKSVRAVKVQANGILWIMVQLKQSVFASKGFIWTKTITTNSLSSSFMVPTGKRFKALRSSLCKWFLLFENPYLRGTGDPGGSFMYVPICVQLDHFLRSTISWCQPCFCLLRRLIRAAGLRF